MDRPIELWRGDFGDAYIQRNDIREEDTASLARCFSQILDLTGPVSSICEVGANIGRNLMAVKAYQPQIYSPSSQMLVRANDYASGCLQIAWSTANSARFFPSQIARLNLLSHVAC